MVEPAAAPWNSKLWVLWFPWAGPINPSDKSKVHARVRLPPQGQRGFEKGHYSVPQLLRVRSSSICFASTHP